MSSKFYHLVIELHIIILQYYFVVLIANKGSNFTSYISSIRYILTVVNGKNLSCIHLQIGVNWQSSMTYAFLHCEIKAATLHCNIITQI